MTNAEKIKSMNTYELSVFLATVKADLSLIENFSYSYSTKQMKENLDWLMKETEQAAE